MISTIWVLFSLVYLLGIAGEGGFRILAHIRYMNTNEFFQKRVVQHISFWLALLTLSVLKDVNHYRYDDFWEILVDILAEFSFQILTSYILAYYLIPKYYSKRRYLLLGLNIIVLLYVSSVLCRYTTIYIAEPIVRAPPLDQEGHYEILTELRYLVKQYTFPILSGTSVFLFVKFFVDYQRERERSLLLRNEKSDMELKALKAQLNPHFLFNTLNNIYSLSVSNSTKTPEAIEKLADILDTILYKCNSDFVSVADEVILLKNYIELEKLRYDKRLEVHFETKITHNSQVPPLIFLSLVENAFKHGASEDSGSPQIWITVASNNIETKFDIKNTLDQTRESKERKNIGFENIQKQLKLLYGKDYSLHTSVSLGFFEVQLILKNQFDRED